MIHPNVSSNFFSCKYIWQNNFLLEQMIKPLKTKLWFYKTNTWVIILPSVKKLFRSFLIIDEIVSSTSIFQCTCLTIIWTFIKHTLFNVFSLKIRIFVSIVFKNYRNIDFIIIITTIMGKCWIEAINDK